jgi:formylglycine-generating enzyme required for sulfatase activity
MSAYEGASAGEERGQFCWCPSGTFTMGPFPGPPVAGPSVEVKFSHGFWMSKYLVTQALFESVMRGNPSGFRGSSLPVESVDKSTAERFCAAYTQMERAAGRLPDEWEYRLPTEAQWEYACAAGTDTDYSWGDDAAKAEDYAWFAKNANDRTHPVGAKKPNPWGLFDMHGNCIEWCRDVWLDKLPGGADPLVTPRDMPAKPEWRQPFWVCRGGSFQYREVERLKTKNRERLGPVDKSYLIGFRLALVRSGY